VSKKFYFLFFFFLRKICAFENLKDIRKFEMTLLECLCFPNRRVLRVMLKKMKAVAVELVRY